MHDASTCISSELSRKYTTYFVSQGRRRIIFPTHQQLDSQISITSFSTHDYCLMLGGTSLSCDIWTIPHKCFELSFSLTNSLYLTKHFFENVFGTITRNQTP
jgi:hypothetical protein